MWRRRTAPGVRYLSPLRLPGFLLHPLSRRGRPRQRAEPPGSRKGVKNRRPRRSRTCAAALEAVKMALVQQLHLFLTATGRYASLDASSPPHRGRRRPAQTAASAAVATTSDSARPAKGHYRSHLLNTMSLSIPVSYHRASAPHHRLQARSERRRQLLQVQDKIR